MKANMIIFISLIIGFWNTYESLSQPNPNTDNTQLIHQLHQEIAQKYNEPSCQYLKSISDDQLVKVVKKDTALGIDMGFYLLPGCWSSAAEGLKGPDGTIVQDYPMTSSAKNLSSFDCQGTEKLDAQSIIDEYYASVILPEILKVRKEVKNYYTDKSITSQYKKNFTALYPCSAEPVHFETRLIEHGATNGQRGLTMFYFMVFHATHGYVLHSSKHELRSKPENFERDKKDYLFAVSQAEYTPEYISKAHQIQRESPQDIWYRYNEQLVNNEFFRYRHYDPVKTKEFRPWRQHRCGGHDDYLQQLDTNYVSKDYIEYDPKN